MSYGGTKDINISVTFADPLQPDTMYPARRQHGFTAIELMVVVSILAILMAIAAPSFKFLIERWHVLQTVDGLKTTLYYARSEALKRGGNVYIEKIAKSKAPGCVSADTNQDWDCGWVVFVDADGDGVWDAGEEIQRFTPSGNVTVTKKPSGKSIAINRWGGANGANLLGFTVAPADGISSPATKGVCMATGGRVRVINQEDVPCS